MINAQGQFVPDQMNQQVARAPTPFNGQVPTQMQQPQMQNQMAMQQMHNQMQRPVQSPQAAPQQGPQQAATQQQQQSPYAPAPWQQGYQQMQQGMPNYGQLGQQQNQFGVAQGQQQQQGQSVMQSVQNNNPQSVQNFMSALNQVGAGSSNGMMNGRGQQGAQGQAGFQGFGSNGQVPMQNQGAQAGGPQMMNSNIQNGNVYSGANPNGGIYGGYGQVGNYGGAGSAYGQQNWAGGGDVGMQNGQSAQGGAGGFVNGQGTNMGQNPQWQTPGLWGNPGNSAPGDPGSDYANTNDGQIQYLNTAAGSPQEAGATQPGSFYSWAAPGTGTQLTGLGSQGQWIGGQSGQGGPLALSDENAKTKIKTGDEELQEFLNALNVYSYEYKDPANGEGRRISPMAQEIESTALGKAAISTNAQGYKQVDYGKLAGTQLAALALLNHKYNILEAKIKTNIANKFKKGKN